MDAECGSMLRAHVHQVPVRRGTNQAGDLPRERIATLSRQQRQMLDTLSGWACENEDDCEGMLWKSVPAKRTSQKGELDSFTQIIRKIL